MKLKINSHLIIGISFLANFSCNSDEKNSTKDQDPPNILIAISDDQSFEQDTDIEFSNPDIQMGMVVSDLDESFHFYTSIIGLVRTGSFDVKPEKARKLGLTDGKELNVNSHSVLGETSLLPIKTDEES